MKIAVFCPNWVGDLVMATPALRGLRTQYPDAEIIGVMRSYLINLLDGTDLLDRSISLPHGKSSNFASNLSALRQLQREKLDLAILLPNSLRSGVWGVLSGARQRIGFDRNARGWLLTKRVPASPRSTPHPVLHEYLRLAAAAGCQSLPIETELAVSPQDRARLEQFWAKHPSIPRREVVCFNSGGAFGAAKHWPTEHFGDLARKIVLELGKTVLVLCGPAERNIAREITRHADHPHVLNLAEEELSLGLSKAAVEQADLLVTTDSGPRHFAPPLGVRSIVLYGPTHQAWSRIESPLEHALQLPLECGPCQERTCPLGHHRCMRDLSPQQVFHTILSLMSSSSQPSIAA